MVVVDSVVEIWGGGMEVVTVAVIQEVNMVGVVRVEERVVEMVVEREEVTWEEVLRVMQMVGVVKVVAREVMRVVERVEVARVGVAKKVKGVAARGVAIGVAVGSLGTVGAMVMLEAALDL